MSASSVLPRGRRGLPSLGGVRLARRYRPPMEKVSSVGLQSANLFLRKLTMLELRFSKISIDLTMTDSYFHYGLKIICFFNQ